MKYPTIFHILIAGLSCLLYCCTPSEKIYRFDLHKIAKTTEMNYQWVESTEFDGKKVLSVSAGEDNDEFILTPTSESIDWSAAKYLVCEVWHDNPYSLLMHLQFFRKTDGIDVKQVSRPRISCVIGILPRLKTQMIFPLAHLDGQSIFVARQPRQMKGFVSGSRINPADVGKVSIRIAPDKAPDYLPTVEIASVYLTGELPRPLEKPAEAVVDSFGQWTARDWPAKVHDADELKASVKKTEAMAASATLPDEWSSYGGWKELRFTATGFFHTHHDGKRWWLVDPEGYAFISAGIDCIEPNATGVLSGQEELFGWLPPENDSLFAGAYQGRQGAVSVDFLKSNLMRVYGDQWQKKWEEITTGLMRKFRVNTVGNWSDNSMARRNHLPYVFNMSAFPTTPVKLYRDFPDVFDPAYAKAAERFARQLEAVRDDPCLIGYFLQNEPHWGFGDNNLAFEMFGTSAPSFTKREMADWLQRRYGTIERFNVVWGVNLSSFDDLETLTMKDRPSDVAWNDCAEFSGIMVDRYVEVVCNEVKKVDPNHLNLGMRYSSISSDLCYRAGAWFDVFSLNGYTNPAPPDTGEISRRSGKPVIIGEWHFGSVDRGLPATGIQGAESQTARGKAYRYYFEQGIARAELVGIHWFQWNDQPVFGRFDGENYNIGFVDICMQPYPELTEQATASHQRMYRVATGKVQPFDEVIRKVPAICY
jgi:hypothetical protein